MVVRTHGAKDYVKGNKASCSDLVEYLNKENEGKALPGQEYFFNNRNHDVNNLTVIDSIDHNVKGLKKTDTKFFMLSINPSQRELHHLATMACGRKIENVSELNPGELEKYNAMLKDYTNNVMELYAAGFYRGLTANDIVYFSKLEQERHFTHADESLSRAVQYMKDDGKSCSAVIKELNNQRAPDVKQFYENGIVHEGDKKEGLQTHIHIVVSRMDRDMKKSISPLANSRGKGKAHMLNGKEVKVGFDRDQFKQEAENLFDKKFGYQREYNEYYSYAKTSQQNAGLNASQINSFVKNYGNKHKNSAVREKDLGDKESMKGLRLAQSMARKDPKAVVQSVLKMGQLDNLHSGDLGRMNHGEAMRFIASLAKGNPVSIAKEALALVKNIISLEI
ncbi:MAG: MobB family relaxase [Tenuifilaceae bacterium]